MHFIFETSFQFVFYVFVFFSLVALCVSILLSVRFYNKKTLKTYQFKTHCKGDSHSSKTANIILPGLMIKQACAAEIAVLYAALRCKRNKRYRNVDENT